MTSYNLMLDCQMLKASNGLLPNHQIDDDKQIGKKMSANILSFVQT